MTFECNFWQKVVSSSDSLCWAENLETSNARVCWFRFSAQISAQCVSICFFDSRLETQMHVHPHVPHHTSVFQNTEQLCGTFSNPVNFTLATGGKKCALTKTTTAKHQTHKYVHIMHTHAHWAIATLTFNK